MKRTRISVAILYSVFCLFSSLRLFAQTDINLGSHFIRDSSENVSINLSSNYFAASKAVTNKMVQDYFYTRFITNETKDGVSKNLKDRNYLNTEYSAELSF